MKISEKKLFILTIATPLAISLVLAFFGYFFLFRKNSQLNTDIADSNKKITESESTRKKMADVKKRIIDLKKQGEQVANQLPSKEEVSYENFINTLTGKSIEADVYLSGAAPDQGRSTQKTQTIFDRISYKVSIKGGFFNVIEYLYLLETAPRFMKVEKFNVRPTSGSREKTMQYTCDLVVTAYIYDKGKVPESRTKPK